MQILAIGNQKGGVGKSSLAVNLAIEAADQGNKVLVVDADVQGSAALFAAARDGASVKFDTVQMVKPILHKELPRIGKAYDLVVIDIGGRDNAAFRSAWSPQTSSLSRLDPLQQMCGPPRTSSRSSTNSAQGRSSERLPPSPASCTAPVWRGMRTDTWRSSSRSRT